MNASGECSEVTWFGLSNETRLTMSPGKGTLAFQGGNIARHITV